MVDKVSVHGGHSGEFCSHAKDPLEAVVAEYVRQGFVWIALTEHMASSDAFLAVEELAHGFDEAEAFHRFEHYFEEARRLQSAYADDIDIMVAFETEAYSGYQTEVAALVEEFHPDYLVGSVHHVNDVPFDASPGDYLDAVAKAGGMAAMYCDYFDLQLELIDAFRPAVVGHFDLIRIHDGDYAQTLQDPNVWERAARNLERIAELDLILDFNVRALAKGQPEPYVSEPLLRLAKELGIVCVPGDDSHGTATVGAGMAEGIAVLIEAGFDTDWPKPDVMQHSR
ncbi:MAG: histidinol-phosphatase [Gammaproteobacteria bacterium]|nr:histidinol-phosphatase [Gammaproteobacteria bacterium]